MYMDTRNMTDADRSRKRRQIVMQQISYQSDLKKLERRSGELKDELRRFEQDRDRLEMHIKEHKAEMQKVTDREIFLNEELRHIKKELIELG